MPVDFKGFSANFCFGRPTPRIRHEMSFDSPVRTGRAQAGIFFGKYQISFWCARTGVPVPNTGTIFHFSALRKPTCRAGALYFLPTRRGADSLDT